MDLTSLLYLFHDNTNLTTIPKAVTNLPSLVGLSLDNTKIRCACPNLDWINTWSRRSKVKILGNFHNIRMTLCEYIYSEFPKCTKLKYFSWISRSKRLFRMLNSLRSEWLLFNASSVINWELRYGITGNFCRYLIFAVFCSQLRAAEIKVIKYFEIRLFNMFYKKMAHNIHASQHLSVFHRSKPH